MATVHFDVVGLDSTEELSIKPDHVYVVGYSGSNKEKTMEHIKELEEKLGVAPPDKIPTIFEVSRELVTQEKDLVFVDDQTSGEAEYIIIKKDGNLYIGLGSDHSDRKLEADSVPKAKQICLKPVSKELWKYEDIKEHFKEIELNAEQDGKPYQKGTLADILSLEEILSILEERLGEGATENSIVFSGTVPLVDDYVYGKNFSMELVDHQLNRSITFDYDVNVVPDEAR